jgi:hypothetical protein
MERKAVVSVVLYLVLAVMLAIQPAMAEQHTGPKL